MPGIFIAIVGIAFLVYGSVSNLHGYLIMGTILLVLNFTNNSLRKWVFAIGSLFMIVAGVISLVPKYFTLLGLILLVLNFILKKKREWVFGFGCLFLVIDALVFAKYHAVSDQWLYMAINFVSGALLIAISLYRGPTTSRSR